MLLNLKGFRILRFLTAFMLKVICVAEFDAELVVINC